MTLLVNLVRREGLEPPTRGLKNEILAGGRSPALDVASVTISTG